MDGVWCVDWGWMAKVGLGWCITQNATQRIASRLPRYGSVPGSNTGQTNYCTPNSIFQVPSGELHHTPLLLLLLTLVFVLVL